MPARKSLAALADGQPTGHRIRLVLVCLGLVLLIQRGVALQVYWLLSNTISTAKALRVKQVSGRKVGVMARRKAMKRCAIDWVIWVVLSALLPVPDKLLGWIPLYGTIRMILILIFFVLQKPLSASIFHLLRTHLKPYEPPIDLTILLLSSTIHFLSHFLIELPLCAISRPFVSAWRACFSSPAYADLATLYPSPTSSPTGIHKYMRMPTAEERMRALMTPGPRVPGRMVRTVKRDVASVLSGNLVEVKGDRRDGDEGVSPIGHRATTDSEVTVMASPNEVVPMIKQNRNAPVPRPITTQTLVPLPEFKTDSRQIDDPSSEILAPDPTFVAKGSVTDEQLVKTRPLAPAAPMPKPSSKSNAKQPLPKVPSIAALKSSAPPTKARSTLASALAQHTKKPHAPSNTATTSKARSSVHTDSDPKPKAKPSSNPDSLTGRPPATPKKKASTRSREVIRPIVKVASTNIASLSNSRTHVDAQKGKGRDGVVDVGNGRTMVRHVDQHRNKYTGSQRDSISDGKAVPQGRHNGTRIPKRGVPVDSGADSDGNGNGVGAEDQDQDGTVVRRSKRSRV